MARRRIEPQSCLGGDIGLHIENYGKLLASQLSGKETLDDIEQLILKERFKIGENLIQHVVRNFAAKELKDVKKNAKFVKRRSKAKV